MSKSTKAITVTGAVKVFQAGDKKKRYTDEHGNLHAEFFTASIGNHFRKGGDGLTGIDEIPGIGEIEEGEFYSFRFNIDPVNATKFLNAPFGTKVRMTCHLKYKQNERAEDIIARHENNFDVVMDDIEVVKEGIAFNYEGMPTVHCIVIHKNADGEDTTAATNMANA